LDHWKVAAFSQQTTPQQALESLLALARVGTKDDQEAILKALGKFPLDSLSDELKLDKLRVIEVTLARHGTASWCSSSSISRRAKPAPEGRAPARPHLPETIRDAQERFPPR
jgi:hypothetical protein